MDRVRTQQIASYRPPPKQEWRPTPKTIEQVTRQVKEAIDIADYGRVREAKS
jgi:hypothetical protein